MVMVTTKMPNIAAPTVSLTPYPSTVANGSQSSAAPSAKPIPSTIRPISRVRGSFHTANRSAVDSFGWAPLARPTPAGTSRTAGMTATTRITAATPRWTPIETPRMVASTPRAAPVRVPMLYMAWKIGITVRPRSRSLAAPATFIDTSQVPKPRPKTSSPANTTPDEARLAPTATTTRPRAAVSNAIRITGRAPKRPIRAPAETRPKMAPPAMAKISQPMCPVEAPSTSRTAGVRDTQAARANPQAAKTTNMAFRQTRASSRAGRSRRCGRGGRCGRCARGAAWS